MVGIRASKPAAISLSLLVLGVKACYLSESTAAAIKGSSTRQLPGSDCTLHCRLGVNAANNQDWR